MTVIPSSLGGDNGSLICGDGGAKGVVVTPGVVWAILGGPKELWLLVGKPFSFNSDNSFSLSTFSSSPALCHSA